RLARSRASPNLASLRRPKINVLREGLGPHLIEKRIQIVSFRCNRLDDDPTALLANVHRLIKAERRRRHYRSRNAHGGAVAPFLDECFHDRDLCEVGECDDRVYTMSIHAASIARALCVSV